MVIIDASNQHPFFFDQEFEWERVVMEWGNIVDKNVRLSRFDLGRETDQGHGAVFDKFVEP